MVKRSLHMEIEAKGMHISRRHRTRVNTNLSLKITWGDWGRWRVEECSNLLTIAERGDQECSDRHVGLTLLCASSSFIKLPPHFRLKKRVRLVLGHRSLDRLD